MEIICENCGFVHKEDPGKFCERCGRVLERFHMAEEGDDSNDHIRCGKCGMRNTADVNVCQNCGELLHKPNF